jgi:hypothetical protein
VNTGEVVVGDAVGGQDVVVGDAVNVAARLEQAADPGEVLIGERTWQLVRDAVTVEPMAPLALKGKGDPVAGFRLLGVRPDAAGHARHLDAPMVSRGRELGLLAGGLERAVGERRGLLTVVLGPAGVGKSRLVQEFVATVRGQAPTSRATSSPSATSTWTAHPRSPSPSTVPAAALVRSTQTTLAPSPASRVAMAAPSPEPAPVTMATRSLNLPMASPAPTVGGRLRTPPDPRQRGPPDHRRG